jgi:hypothetical protein
MPRRRTRGQKARCDRDSLALHHQTCGSSTNDGPSAIRTAGRVCAARGHRSRSLCQRPRPAPVPQHQAEPTGSGASLPPGVDAGRCARDWVSEKPDHRPQWHRVLARQPQAGRTPQQPHDRPRAEPPTPHEYWSVDLARSTLLHVTGFIRLVNPNRRRRQPASPRPHRPRPPAVKILAGCCEAAAI